MDNVPISSIILVIIVFVIGILAFNTLNTSISGPHASTTMNATMEAGSSVFNITGIILVMGVIMASCILLFYWVSTPQRYNKPTKFINFIISSAIYFSYGLLSIVIIAIPAYFTWFLWNYIMVEGNSEPFYNIIKLILICIVSYFAIAGVGYISKKYFFDKWALRRQEKEYQNNIEDLPKTYKQ